MPYIARRHSVFLDFTCQTRALLTFRNESPAFDLDGGIEISTPSETEIVITRFDVAKANTAILTANAKTFAFEITFNGEKIKL